ncbi:MAG: DUF2382 domain-containing protein [Nodosilinea sp.]
MFEHQLTNSSVFDRSGSLIGRVVSLAQDESLVVQPLVNGQPGAELLINKSRIKSIDAERETIIVDLDYPQTAPSTEKTIQLVEERLVVNRKRVKVGEISVRRVVETEIVEVPIRREKLVVERIGEGNPLVEITLGEPRLRGNGFDSSSGIDSNTDDLTASGSLATIRDVVSFLESADTLDHHCEKVRVYIFLKQKTGLKATVHQFESSETALQILTGLEATLQQQCSNVRLELFLKDNSMLKTYQDWFDRSASPSSGFDA